MQLILYHDYTHTYTLLTYKHELHTCCFFNFALIAAAAFIFKASDVPVPLMFGAVLGLELFQLQPLMLRWTPA